MHHLRPHWLQLALAVLLVAASTGCIRSANTGMTPLPSLPPPTPTTASTEPGPDTTTAEPAEGPSATAARPTASATATPKIATPTATATLAAACGTALPTRLRVGAFAYVNPDPPLPNNLRSEAGQDSTLIGEIQPGQAMKITGGPECADDQVWWNVQVLETDLVGWTAEGDDQDYWLVPCASQESCGP